MSVNILFAVGSSISVEQMLDAIENSGQPMTINHGFKCISVRNEQANQSRYIVAGPKIGHVSFSKANVTRL